MNALRPPSGVVRGGRFRSSQWKRRLPRREWILALVVFGTISGCQAVSQGPRGSRGTRSDGSTGFDAHRASIETALDDVATAGVLVGETTTTVPDTLRNDVETRGREAADAISKYGERLVAASVPWRSLTAATLVVEVDESAEIWRSAERAIEAYSEQRALVVHHLHRLPNPQDPSVRLLREYVERVEALGELLGRSKQHATQEHIANLDDNVEVDHPAEKVYHFRVLESIDAAGLPGVVEEYRRHWRAWIAMRQEVSGAGPALRIVALGLSDGSEFPASHAKDIGSVLRPCVDVPPPATMIEDMDLVLRSLEERFPAGDRRDELFEAEVERARAILFLCRAHVASSADRALSLAAEALQRSATLSDAVRAFFLRVGDRLLTERAAEGEYVAAVSAFAEAVRESGLGGWEELTRKFREHVFRRALADLELATTTRRFDDGKRIAFEARNLASGPAEVREARDRYYELFLRYAPTLEESDPSQFVRVCEEMLEEFPGDRRAVSMIDRAHVRAMQERIGDPTTSHRRHKARDILRIVREASSVVKTDKGAVACEGVVREVEMHWRRQLDVIAEPGEVFPLAREIAELSGLEVDDVKRLGAQSLRRIYANATYRDDWSSIERVVRAFRAECPEAPRPRGCEETELRLLAFLEREGRTDDLADHLGFYVSTYPDRAPTVGGYIDRHGSGPSGRDWRERYEAARGGAALPTQSVASTSTEASAPDSEAVPPAPDRERGADVLAGTADDAPSARSAVLKKAQWGVAGSGVLFALALALVSRRRGLRPFGWYAAAAVWWGLSLGLFLS